MRRLQCAPVHGGKQAHEQAATLSLSHGSIVCVNGRRGNRVGVHKPLPEQRLNEQATEWASTPCWLEVLQCLSFADRIKAARMTFDERSTASRQAHEKCLGAIEISMAVGGCR